MKPSVRLIAPARACALAFLALAYALPAHADPKAGTKSFSFGLDVSFTPTPSPASPAPARFFTINQVLAKIDGRAPTSDRVRVATLTSPSALADVPANLGIKPVGSEPFGLTAFAAPNGTLWDKWRALDANYRGEADAIEACRQDPESCSIEAVRLLDWAANAGRFTGTARIDAVNERVNAAIRYVSDLAQHGVADQWTSPLSTLRSGRGDCEDYAFLKLMALREVGVPAEDLRVMLVRDRPSRQDHAILAVRDSDGWRLLDNRYDVTTIDAATDRFTPLFSIGSDGVRLLAAPYATLQTGAFESSADILPGASESADVIGDFAEIK